MLINIYQARNLTPCDSDGTSDPFVKVTYLDRKHELKPVDSTLNPIYNERVVFQGIEIPMLKESPPIIIEVWDNDPIGADFIGSCFLEPAQAEAKKFLSRSEKEADPAWLPLYSAKMKAGEVLVGLRILSDEGQKIPSTISMDCVKYRLKIQALGLRNLKSAGIIPVRRAFVQFDMKSLALLSGQKNREPIRTEPKESGSDPNICSIITEDILLPSNPTLWPNLSCLVYDYVIEGLYEPCLGYFAIDLVNYKNMT
jgi:hypothetical protein